MNESAFASEVAKRIAEGINNKSAELVEHASRRSHPEITGLAGEIVGLKLALAVMDEVAHQMNEANNPKEQQ